MMKAKTSTLTLFWIIAMTLSFAIFLLASMNGGYEGEQSKFFYDRGHWFLSDFSAPCAYVEDLNPYQAEIAAADRILPPLGFAMLYPFARIIKDAPSTTRNVWGAIYLTWCSIALFYTCQASYQGSKKLRFLALFPLFFSSVFLFALERGNVVILSVAFTFFFLRFYQSEQPFLKHAAFISLAVAAGMKVYPALFGVLLLYEKRYRDAFILLLYGLVIAMLPILFFEGGVLENLMAYLSNLALHAAKYKHRIYARFGLPYVGQPWYYTYFRALNLLSYVFTAMSLVFLPFYQRKWQKILVLCCILVLMPVSSVLYNGVYLLPVVMMILSDKERRLIDFVYVGLFVAMFAPYRLPLIGEQQSNYCLILIWLLLLAEGGLGFLRWWKERSANHRSGTVV